MLVAMSFIEQQVAEAVPTLLDRSRRTDRRR